MNKEYEKYKYCKAVNCPIFDYKDDFCMAPSDAFCNHTAKEFHHWLEDNGYRIVKETNDALSKV